ITKNGLHYVGDCLVSESESAFDPFWPVKDSRLSSVLSQNSSLRVRSLGLDLIRQGSQAVLKEIRSNRSEQRVLWAADAETEADLEVLALAGLAASDRFILCGSGGLAGALSRKLNGRQAKAQDDLKKPLADQPTLFLAGSTSVVLKQQIEVLVKTEGAQLITLNLAEFIGGNLTWPDNLKPALAKITGPLIINLPPREDKGGYSSRQIIESFGVLAASLIVELKPRCLFISGGDTARSVLNALGIGAAWLKAEIEPGVALLQAGPWSVLTKSGGFGDPELLRRLYLGSGPQAKKPKIKPGWPEEKLPEARLKAPRAGKKAGQKRESSQ
ncbi:MAG: hypothetical protein LBE80_03860, partial [Deltaproteobacteria bacterium]|nr:hypothetical protein [Deltaproteobacteria bacterium]